MAQCYKGYWVDSPEVRDCVDQYPVWPIGIKDTVFTEVEDIKSETKALNTYIAPGCNGVPFDENWVIIPFFDFFYIIPAKWCFIDENYYSRLSEELALKLSEYSQKTGIEIRRRLI